MPASRKLSTRVPSSISSTAPAPKWHCGGAVASAVCCVAVERSGVAVQLARCGARTLLTSLDWRSASWNSSCRRLHSGFCFGAPSCHSDQSGAAPRAALSTLSSSARVPEGPRLTVELPFHERSVPCARECFGARSLARPLRGAACLCYLLVLRAGGRAAPERSCRRGPSTRGRTRRAHLASTCGGTGARMG